MSQPKIVYCEFKPDETFKGLIVSGVDLSESCPHVHVTYDDGHTEELFSFFTDEIRFMTTEFIGLTKQDAMSLWRERDIEYLRS